MFKAISLSIATTAMLTTGAAALVITNKDAAEQKIGVHMGNKQRVDTIAAGKTLDLSKDCADGCGLTGPWGFSWMAKTGEDFGFDSKKGIIKPGS